MSAHERASTVAYLPYVLDGIYPNNTRLEVFVAYNEWREIRDASRHASSSLAQLTAKRIDAQTKILKVFPVRNKKGGGWNFPKFWNMCQYEQWIPWVGDVGLVDTGSDERSNKIFKEGKGALNNRVQDTNKILLRELMVSEELIAIKARYLPRTGLGYGITQRAADSMDICVSRGKTAVKYEEFVTRSPNVQAMLENQPELKHFRNKLLSYLDGGRTAGRVVYFHKALAMPPAEDDSRGTYIVRATHLFHGEPRFDTVQVFMATETEPNAPDEYFQVRAIFSYHSTDDAGERNPAMHLALFGRWYVRLTDRNPLHSLKLRWEKQTSGRETSYRYDCIDLNSVKFKRVVVLPNFSDSQDTPPLSKTFHVYRNWG